YRKPEERAAVTAAANQLSAHLAKLPRTERLGFDPSTVKGGDRAPYPAGVKLHELGPPGNPVPVELGPNDLAKQSCVLKRRDLPGKEAKELGVPLAGAADRIAELLRLTQANLLDRARKYRDANSFEVNSYEEFKQKIEEPGGFLWAHWDGTR